MAGKSDNDASASNTLEPSDLSDDESTSSSLTVTAPLTLSLMDPVDTWEYEWLQEMELPLVNAYSGPNPGLTFDVQPAARDNLTPMSVFICI